jgi:adenine deaminase
MGDLLDEIRFVHSEVGLDANTTYKMVTSNATEMLRLEYGAGQIAQSGVANVIAVRVRKNTPASTLSQLKYEEIELVVRSGQVAMASPTVYERLPHDYRKEMQLIDIAGNSRWIRAPLQALVGDAENILGQGNLFLSGRQVRYLSAL